MHFELTAYGLRRTIYRNGDPRFPTSAGFEDVHPGIDPARLEGERVRYAAPRFDRDRFAVGRRPHHTNPKFRLEGLLKAVARAGIVDRGVHESVVPHC